MASLLYIVVYIPRFSCVIQFAGIKSTFLQRILLNGIKFHTNVSVCR